MKKNNKRQPPYNPKNYVSCNAMSTLFGEYEFMPCHTLELLYKFKPFCAQKLAHKSFLDVSHLYSDENRMSSTTGLDRERGKHVPCLAYCWPK